MKRLIRQIICSLLVILAIPVAGAVENTGSVARLFPFGGNIFFRLSNDDCNKLDEDEYYFIDMISQQPAAKNWFAMLVAASATGKPVTVNVLSCEIPGNKPVNFIYQDFTFSSN